MTTKQAPGPRGGLVLGSLRDVRSDPLHVFLEAAKQYGGLVRFRIAHKSLFLISHPEYIRHVLQDNMKNYVKGVSYEVLRSVMGTGLLVAEGDLWRRHRKLMNPMFTRQRFMEKTPIVGECVHRLLRDWVDRDGQTLDMVPELMRLAFDVVGRTLMGADIADQMHEIERVIKDATEHVYARMQSPIRLPDTIPTPSNVRAKRLIKALHRVVERTIERRRKSSESGHDFLGLLMQARDDETEHGMSDRELRDEVLTFLLAGHETTGASLAWTFKLLAEHPEADRHLYEEAQSVLSNGVPTADHVARLVYTQRVVQESMRLYPPAWAFTRTAVGPDTMGGYRIPKGSYIVISPWVNHRLPQFWEEPERFDPDRFLPERSANRPTYAYFPFGGGPHSCIGMPLSMLEVILTTAMIARRWHMEMPRQIIRPEPRISLLPRPGILMTLRART